ncbi:MAG: hypothetical protein Ct9H90mP2_10600 [Dehalococcoidia bacterium]|nr:MAG: hypothetical protein Ct9H90mP2_10600 [Dehalococcoidia bacterium]
MRKDWFTIFKTHEAPAKGNHWGMATPHGSLPRGTRIVKNKNIHSKNFYLDLLLKLMELETL